VCERLRTIYFKDEPWPVCAHKVSQKFTLFKEIMRKFYSFEEEIKLMMELAKYSPEDIKEAIEGSANDNKQSKDATTVDQCTIITP